MLPRGVMRPMPGSIAGAPGFSTSQVRTVDSPGLIDEGFASNVTMRAGGPPRPRPAGGAPCAGAAGAPAPCGAWATAVIAAMSTPMTTASDRLTSPSQKVSNVSSGPSDRNAYERISRPSASFIRLAIIDGAPLLAGAPVAESVSPCLTVLLVQP